MSTKFGPRQLLSYSEKIDFSDPQSDTLKRVVVHFMVIAANLNSNMQ